MSFIDDPLMSLLAKSQTLRLRLRYFDGVSDLLLFLRIGALLALMPLLLAALPLPRLLRWLDPGVSQSVQASTQVRKLARYTDFWLGRIKPVNRCLRRSLVLFGQLRRAGVAVEFCIGVCHSDIPDIPTAIRPIEAHAWLELDNRVFLETSESVSRYAPTYRYPSPP